MQEGTSWDDGNVLYLDYDGIYSLRCVSIKTQKLFTKRVNFY